MASHVVSFESIRRVDGGRGGGKNASLGEMVSNLTHQGVRVPRDFRRRLTPIGTSSRSRT